MCGAFWRPSTKRSAAPASLAYEESKVKFDDVGGLARLKHWIALRRKPFLDPSAANVDRPKGIVLLGVQGGGKSLAARAVAGEWGVPLMRLDFGALYNKYYGETERNLRNAFAAAEAMSPCVLWIDEIEKGISVDGGDGDGGVSRRVLGSLLTWMSERTEPVFIVATSNDISQLPPELIRKGVSTKSSSSTFPNDEARIQIATIHLKKRGYDPAQFDVAGLAQAVRRLFRRRNRAGDRFGVVRSARPATKRCVLRISSRRSSARGRCRSLWPRGSMSCARGRRSRGVCRRRSQACHALRAKTRS